MEKNYGVRFIDYKENEEDSGVFMNKPDSDKAAVFVYNPNHVNNDIPKIYHDYWTIDLSHHKE